MLKSLFPQSKYGPLSNVMSYIAFFDILETQFFVCKSFYTSSEISLYNRRLSSIEKHRIILKKPSESLLFEMIFNWKVLKVDFWNNWSLEYCCKNSFEKLFEKLLKIVDKEKLSVININQLLMFSCYCNGEKMNERIFKMVLKLYKLLDKLEIIECNDRYNIKSTTNINSIKSIYMRIIYKMLYQKADLDLIEYFSNDESVKGILQRNPHPIIKTALLNSCEKEGNEKKVKVLLNKVVDNHSNWVEGDYFIYFYISCGSGDFELSKQLLEKTKGVVDKFFNNNKDNNIQLRAIYKFTGYLRYLYQSFWLSCKRGNIKLLKLIIEHEFFENHEMLLIKNNFNISYLSYGKSCNKSVKYCCQEYITKSFIITLTDDNFDILNLITDRYKTVDTKSLIDFYQLSCLIKDIDEKHFTKIFDFLIKIGLNASVQLNYMLYSNDKKAASYILANYKDLNMNLVINNSNCLGHCVSNGIVDLVDFFLENTDLDENCLTNSIIACFKEYPYTPIELLHKLIKKMSKSEKGFKMKISDNRIFRDAVKYNRKDFIKFLLEYTDINPSCNNNYGVIMCCRSYPRIEILRLLIKDDRVDPSMERNWPLKSAISFEHTELVEILLKNPKVDPNMDIHKTLLVAFSHKNERMIKMLLEDNRMKVNSLKSILNKVNEQMYQTMLQNRINELSKAKIKK